MKRRIHFVVLGILFHFTKEEEEEVNKDISIHIYVDTRKNKRTKFEGKNIQENFEKGEFVIQSVR